MFTNSRCVTVDGIFILIITYISCFSRWNLVNTWDNTRPIREWLNKTYREHDHEKLSEVPKLLEMYADNPLPLIKRIIKKYKIKTNRLPKSIRSIMNEKKKGGKTKSSKKAKETTSKKSKATKESKAKTSKKSSKTNFFHCFCEFDDWAAGKLKRQSSKRRDRNRQKISMQGEALNAIGEKSFEDMTKEGKGFTILPWYYNPC